MDSKKEMLKAITANREISYNRPYNRCPYKLCFDYYEKHCGDYLFAGGRLCEFCKDFSDEDIFDMVDGGRKYAKRVIIRDGLDFHVVIKHFTWLEVNEMKYIGDKE